MALLKEDGSLDIERINTLPLDEYKKEIFSLSSEQYHEFMSNSCRGIIKKNQKPVQPILVKRSLQEELESGNVFRIEDVINNIQKHLLQNL